VGRICGGRTAEGGISVDATALHDLPHTVLLSDELATVYEF
jgi:hypothetical protein